MVVRSVVRFSATAAISLLSLVFDAGDVIGPGVVYTGHHGVFVVELDLSEGVAGDRRGALSAMISWSRSPYASESVLKQL